MAKFPIDAPRRKVVKTLEILGFSPHANVPLDRKRKRAHFPGA